MGHYGNAYERICLIEYVYNYCRDIWEGVLKLCNVLKRVLGWSHEVDWAVKFLKGKSLLVVILRLAWCAFIYLVWRERNHRLFRHTCKSGQDILQAIIEVVQTPKQWEEEGKTTCTLIWLTCYVLLDARLGAEARRGKCKTLNCV
ncbi:hypothetical protein GQ457_05G033910 [Hibiscus cannabinus]